MTTQGYKIEVLQADDGSWTATVPDLPLILVSGETREAAVAMAEEAIGIMIEELQGRGLAVPLPNVF